MIVYLTGGIGAGKSTALAVFEELGATVLRADDVVHALLAEPGIGQQVETALGLPDGSDRAAIAAKVFEDPDARRRLEAIIHPQVAQRVRDRASRLGPDEVLVYEVPLLSSTDAADAVLFLNTPEAERVRRLANRGISTEAARKRIAAQPTEAAYRSVATHEISNVGTPEMLRAAIERFWKDIGND